MDIADPSAVAALVSPDVAALLSRHEVMLHRGRPYIVPYSDEVTGDEVRRLRSAGVIVDLIPAEERGVMYVYSGPPRPTFPRLAR